MADSVCSADCAPSLYHYRCKHCHTHFSGDDPERVAQAMFEHPCSQVLWEAELAIHAPHLTR